MAVPTLRDMSIHDLETVVAHPAQQRTVRAIAALIADLRNCRSAADYYTFQGELCRHIYEVESHRADVSRCIKRLRRGGKLPADAPDLTSGLPPGDLDSWRLENLAYERIARQLRCVGDALAWRVSDFDRAFITAIAQNAPAGPIVNKAGLDYELGTVVSIFNSTGHFVLLHDLTNCARIADATEFAADGKRWLREVKKSGRSDPRQTERAQQAVDALTAGGPLPGRPRSAVVHLVTPLRTHISAFRDAIALTARDGVASLLVSRGNRGVVCADLMVTLARAPQEHWLTRWAAQTARVQRRLHLGTGTDELVINTGDSAARSTSLVPFGNFPISPLHAARLICDHLVAEVHLPARAVIDAIEARGFVVEFPIGGRNTTVEPEGVSFIVRRGDRSITLHGAAVTQLLIEFLTLDTLADSLAELMDSPNPPEEPVPVNGMEDATWV